jgi:hypothetical protein
MLDGARALVVLRKSKMTMLVGLGSLLAMGGCSSIKVHLGLRVSLAKIPLASMQVSLPKDPGVAPGEKTPLVVTLTGQDGKIWVTEGAGKGKVLWKDLAVVASVVSVNKKGVVSLPRDPRVSDGKTGHVAITAVSQPGVHSELDIPVRYDYPFVSSFAGRTGSGGFNGTDGTDGSSGSPGSTDPDNPSPGGSGSSGGNGSDGTDGGAGGDGPAVEVRVTLRAGSHPLLQAGVSAAGHKERFYLVDPQGGTLMVKSDGGDGGPGGKGGRGGRGGSGGIGTPNGSNGSDGSSGRDGNDGQAGRGGSITVTYDPSAKPFLNALHLSNAGGPSPVFKEEAVAPLW